MLAAFEDRKRDEYLGAHYWAYYDDGMAYREAFLHELIEHTESFNGSVRTAILDDYFFEEEHQNLKQQSQLPLGSVAPPGIRPMTPPPIPFGKVVTPPERVVNPPECYDFEYQGPEVTMRNTPPRSPTPENQPLEATDES